MLELDLVFEKFWARGTGLSAGEMAAMERLLTMPDNDLLDLVMGRSETGDPEIRAAVEKLRGEAAMEAKAKGGTMEAKGTTQKFVGLGYLRGFPINLPPLETQLELVEELDELSVETQRLETIYQRKLAALEALKKSLMHQAFTGNL